MTALLARDKGASGTFAANTYKASDKTLLPTEFLAVTLKE